MCNVFGSESRQNAPYTPILTDKILLGGPVKRLEVFYPPLPDTQVSLTSNPFNFTQW